MDRLSRVSIDVLRDAQLSGLRLDVEEGVSFLTVKAIRQRVEQRAELTTVRICGHNLEKKIKKQMNPKLLIFRLVRSFFS